MEQILDKLKNDLRTKYERYSVSDAQGNRLLNFAGFKYLVRSCPGLDKTEEDILKLFTTAAGSDNTRTAKLNFDIFIQALQSLAVSVYEPTNPDTVNTQDQDTYLVKLLVSHVLPQKLEDPEIQAALQAANKGKSSSSTSVSVDSHPPLTNTTVPSTSTSLPSVSSSSSATVSKITPPRPTVPHDLSTDISHGIIKSITPSVHQPHDNTNVRHDSTVHHLVKSMQPSPSSSSSSSSTIVNHTHTTSTNKNHNEVLQEFLVSVRLDSFTSAFRDLGVDTVQDLTELQDNDLDAIGMKALHKRRFKDAISRWKHDSTAAHPGDTSSVSSFSNGVPMKHHEITSPTSIAAKEAEVAAILLGSASTTASPVKHEIVPTHHSPSASSFSGKAEKNQIIAEKENKPETSTSSSSPSTAQTTQTLSKLAAITSTVYEWEEYANPDGFLYYHCPSTGVTQWLRPFSNSIRTVAQRETEKAALAAMVEERMRQALLAAASGNAIRKPVATKNKSPVTDNSNITKESTAISTENNTLRSSPKQVWQEVLNDATIVPGGSNDSNQYSKSSPRKSFGTVDPTSSYSAAVAAVLAEDEAENEHERLKQQQQQTVTGRPSIRSVSRGNATTTNNNTTNNYRASTAGSRSRARSVDERTRGSSAHSRSPGKSPLKNAPMRTNSTHSKAFVQSSRSNSVSHAADEFPGGFNDALIDPHNTSIPDGRSVVSASSSTYLGRRPPPTPSTALALRNAAANRSIGGESLAETYADVFGEMPSMDDATVEVIARAHSIANPRKMGYADPRPDVRPTSSFGVHEDHRAERVHFTAASSNGGKSFAEFASSLRSHLYSPRVDPNTPRTGKDHMDKWNSPGLAPSHSTTSYAYKHASAVSRWAGQGNVFDRLTDHRGYVGTHKHRFDTDGRGTGLSGRDSGVDTQWIQDSIPENANQGAPYLVPTGVRSGYGYAATSGKVASTRE